VSLTPHQWRHTFGTRLVNRDVPLEVVRVLLDHESLEMSSHYANSQELHQAGENLQVAC
jgi:integrase